MAQQEQVRQFLSDLFGDVTAHLIYLSCLKNDGSGEAHRLRTRDLDKAAAFAERHDGPDTGIYFCVSTIKPDATTRSKDTISEIILLHADVDFKDIAEFPAQAFDAIAGLPRAPSRIVFSGHGYHAYWFLDPLPATPENIVKVEQLLRQLRRLLAADDKVCHPAALMRLPGSRNTKNGESVPVDVVWSVDNVYSFDELFTWLRDAGPPVLTAKAVASPGKPNGASAGNGSDSENAFLGFAAGAPLPAIDIDARFAAMRHHGPGDTAVHVTQLECSASLLSRGNAVDDVVPVILQRTRGAVGADGEAWNWRREEQKIRRMCLDWVAKHPEIAHAPAQAPAPQKEPEPKVPLPYINMSTWDEEPPPDQEWSVDGRIPSREVSLFSGEGGSGKSTIALQECAAHTLARDWLGRMPEPGPALYIECEDGEPAIHRRLYAIAEHYQVRFADMIKGGLHMLSFAGRDAILATPTRSGKIEPTPLFKSVIEAAGDIKPRMIAIASSANVFAGNELSRSEVQQFIGLLTRLGIVAAGAVTLLSHPSLTGIKSESGISGTTQWHNAVRARFYLRGVKPAADELPDNDLREIVFLKNQYGRRDESLVLRWENGLFKPVPGALVRNSSAADTKADDVFLTILTRLHDQSRYVTHVSGTAYAPCIFEREDEAKKAGLGKKQLEGAMRRLFQAHRIRIEDYGRPSRPHHRIIPT